MSKAEAMRASGLLSRLLSATQRVTGRVTKRDQRTRLLRVLGLIAASLYLGLSASSAGATTWTVSDTADSVSDANSVRYAINHAQSGDTVTFANSLDGQVIVLSNGPLSISRSIAVQGPGARLLTISGGSSTTVFAITSGTVTISSLTISNGHAATNGSGGGVTISGGTVGITASTFAGNSAQNGGAIANSGILTVTNSTFFDNSALSLGGAIQNSGTLTVTNGTFSSNSAEVSGGAIDNNSGTTVLNNTTISGNSAETTGGGIFNSTSSSPAPTVTAVNTIVAGNTTGGVLGSDDCDNCGAQSASNLIGGAPQLGALGWNGGLTQTMIPVQASPVIGAGSYQTGEPGADQRGFKRASSASAKIDLGAVQTNYLTVTTLADDGSPASCGSSCTLRDAFNVVTAGGSADVVFKSGLVSSAAPGIAVVSGVLPDIAGHLNLIGPGSDSLTIQSQSDEPAFGNFIAVDSGAVAALSGFTLDPSGGMVVNQAIGINNSGTVTINDVPLLASDATSVMNSGTMIASGLTTSAAFSEEGADALINSGVALLSDGMSGNIQNTGTLLLNSISFNSVSGSSAGGAINNSGTATVTSSAFSNNSAYYNGGAISNTGSLTIKNSTFYSNSANDRGSNTGSGYGGGAIYNGGVLSITSSTFASNDPSGGITAGGIANYGSALTVTNSLFFDNGGGDCSGDGCPQNGVSGNVVGVSDTSFTTFDSHGGSTQTILPAPGSPAICAGSPALVSAGLTVDQRGFPRLNTTYAGYSSSPCVDSGAVQTNYTSVSFVQQPTDSVAGEPVTPAPSLQVLESNPNAAAPNNVVAVNGISVTLVLNGTGMLEGTSTEVSSGGVATFDDLIVNQGGTADTLSTSLPITSEETLKATSSPFKVTTVSGSPATHFVVTGQSSATAGVPFSITVTAQDANNQTATGYNGTVHLTSSDPTAKLPPNSSVSSGVGTFTVTLFAAQNSSTITVTDTTHATIAGSGSFAVAAAQASNFSVSAPATAVTEASFGFTVTPLDPYGNPASNYSGIVHFTSSDKAATLPADTTLFFGINLTATLVTQGTQTITATDTQNASITGVSNSIAVSSAFNLVVTTAADDSGNAANCTIQSQPNAGKDASCSLRDAILNSNNSPGALITFDSKVFASSNTVAKNTINLKSALPIGASMTIQGPGANVVTVSGGGVGGVFATSGTGPYTIAGIAIANGSAVFGGGIDNEGSGTLTVNDSLFSGNNASGGSGFDISQYANGGAIYNNGTLVVNRSAFINNNASGNSLYEDSLSGSGGAIFSGGTATVNNSTFYENSAAPAGDGGSAFAGLGGAIANLCGTLAINSSTIVGNSAAGEGSGVYNGRYGSGCPQNATITNSIIADCDGCGTQSPYNLISLPGDIFTAPVTPIGNFGGPTQSMLPVPGSTAICAGSAALIPAGITTDQRGDPRLNTTYTGYTAKNACVDLGAVQTNFESVQFTNAGSGYTAVANQTVSPAETPIVSVTESGQNIGGIPVTLKFAGTGTASGLGPVMTVSGVGASFSGLTVSAAGTDTLSDTIQVTPTYSITTDPDAKLTVTANAVSAPTLHMAFGVKSIPLTSATTLTFTLNNPNASVVLTSAAYSDTLPAGLVVTTPNGLSNTCGGTVTAAAGSSSIVLTGGTIPKAASCVVSVSVTGTVPGNYMDTSSALNTAQAQGNSASASVTVAALTVTYFSISAPATVTAGTPITFTVQAMDASNTPVTTYSTTLHFTTGDPAAILPADSPLINGTGTYTATLITSGSQVISAADKVNPSVTGNSNIIAVSALNLVVTTSNDDAGNMANCTAQANSNKGTDASCSLRDALLYATQANTGNITFDETAFATAKTIELGSAGSLVIPDNTSITGRTSGSGYLLTNLVTVSGPANSLVPVFSASANIGSINSLIISNGGPGGLLSVSNSESFNVNNSTLSNNQAGTGNTIYNNGILTFNSSTISGNTSNSGSIVYNVVAITLNNSTIFGNTVASNGAVLALPGVLYLNESTITGNTGGTIISSTSYLEMYNSIVSGDNGQECVSNPSSYSNTGCAGTLLGNILEEPANLSAPGNYGGPTQTVLPLPGSPAICAVTPPSATGTDQRGLPGTITYGTTVCQDSGAVQTNYSLAFAQQPTATPVSQPITPAPAVQLNESGSAFLGGAVTIPLTLTGNGKLAGGSAVTIATTGLATYSALSVSATGTGDTLTANLTLNGTIAISSGPSQAFDVTAAGGRSQTISFTLASPVTYGVAPITLSATATSGLAVTFNVVSGPGAISGDTLTVNGVGTIIVAANQAGNASYSPAPQVTQTLIVNQSALTITANNATKVYGTANPAFTGTVTGAKDGDTFTESFTTPATVTSNVGAYAIVPSAAGTKLADYTQVIKNGSLSVTQAASTTALTVSSASITPGQSVTLTAKVTSATSGTPTGTVSFYDGTALLSAANLSAGAVTYATAALAAGTTHTFTATYSGDTDFTGSNASASATVTVAPLSFTLTPPTSTALTATPGSSVSTSFTLDPLYGSYAAPVTFAVSGLPTGATAVFSPSTIAANAGKQAVTLTIKIPATTAMRGAPSSGSKLPPVTLALLFLPLLASGRMLKRGRAMSRIFSVLSLVLISASVAVVLAGCGGKSGGSSSSTSPKTSILTVTATSGTVQQSTTITLDVQ